MTTTLQPSKVQHIDEARLETDLQYRFGYLAEFMNFGADDIAAIHATAPYLAPAVPGLVDAIYNKLFGYDATKRHFVPKQFGYEGPVPKSIAELTQEHEQIQFRKTHLGAYLKRLVTGDYSPKMVSYLDWLGQIHTSKAGSKELNIPLVQMDALMGFVADALIATIWTFPLEEDGKAKTIRAFNKLLWIQNDLIVRHYAA